MQLVRAWRRSWKYIDTGRVSMKIIWEYTVIIFENIFTQFNDVEEMLEAKFQAHGQPCNTCIRLEILPFDVSSSLETHKRALQTIRSIYIVNENFLGRNDIEYPHCEITTTQTAAATSTRSFQHPSQFIQGINSAGPKVVLSHRHFIPCRTICLPKIFY